MLFINRKKQNNVHWSVQDSRDPLTLLMNFDLYKTKKRNYVTKYTIEKKNSKSIGLSSNTPNIHFFISYPKNFLILCRKLSIRFKPILFFTFNILTEVRYWILKETLQDEVNFLLFGIFLQWDWGLLLSFLLVTVLLKKTWGVSWLQCFFIYLT